MTPPSLKLNLLRALAGFNCFLTVLFGVLFPIMGAVIWFFGIAPPGEDPRGPAGAALCAGPCTALFYLPIAAVMVTATRKVSSQAPDARNWALGAAALSISTCAPVGILLIFLILKSPDEVSQTQE